MRSIANIVTGLLLVITAVDAYMYYTGRYYRPWFVLSALLAVVPQIARRIELGE
jgi:hypothetical protein